jgi:quercetin dioxygenase-like cupin family protein
MTFFNSPDVRKLTKEEFCEFNVQSSQPFKSDPSEVLSYNIARGMMTDVKAVIHAEGHQTGNALGLMEVWWGAGDVAGPHVHTLEDEAFYILDGELTLSIPGKVDRVPARKGEFVWAPRNMPHWYEVTGDEGAHVLVFEVPGGSLMSFFRGVAAGWGADIESDEKLAEFAQWSDEKFGIKFFPFDHPFQQPEW